MPASTANRGQVRRRQAGRGQADSGPADPGQARRPPEIGPAPGRLELVRAFVNSLDIEEGTEELASPEALAGWLTARGLGGEQSGTGQAAVAATAGDLRTAIELRECLRQVLLAHASRTEPSEASAAGLASVAAGLPVRLEATADGALRPAPAGPGIGAGLADLLLIAAEARTNGTWARLKVCGADDCRWAFYDRSPARNGCWCSMAICGSRAKSRAYRRRSRPGAGRD